MHETLLYFITRLTVSPVIVLILILIAVVVFTVSVIRDKRDNNEGIDGTTILHTKTFKIGILSIVIGIIICLFVDFSGGIELTLTGFAFIFLRQSIQNIQN